MAADVGTAPASPSTHVRPGTLARMPGLDGIRAVAVMAVLLFHANPTWLPGGFLGVDVFFTLSGFLITSLLLTELEARGGLRLGRFYQHRAKRLLPALLLVLARHLTARAHGRPGCRGARPRGRGRLRAVRHQLVVRRPRHPVLRVHRPAPAAAAPVVARGRGAVLPRLARSSSTASGASAESRPSASAPSPEYSARRSSWRGSPSATASPSSPTRAGSTSAPTPTP